MAFTHHFDPTVLREYDIRGIVGKTLHGADAFAIGRCFGTIVARGGGSVVAVGYDGLTVFACLLDKPPRIRIHAPLMLGVRQSLPLLARLNEFNTGASHLHFFFREGNIYAMADLPAVPMVARHLSGVFHLFCELADGVDELLAAEFGGTIRYSGDMPSRLRH